MNISILFDEILEGNEVFAVSLNTSDSNIIFVEQSSPINIMDNDGIFISMLAKNVTNL